MRTCRFRTASHIAAFAAGLCLAAWAARPAFAQPADRALLDQMPGRGIEYRMPERIFPLELAERLRHKAQYMWFVRGEVHVERVGKWKAVPLERWRELIWDFAPVSCTGCHTRPYQWGRCPFTGKPFGGAHVSEDDFVKTPFQARAAGGNIVYAREADMPPDYPARPNHTEMIPHLDGTERAYRFYVPAEFKNAGPEHNSARRNWFCPAGEVWRARVIILMRRVIPDLLAAVLIKDDREAAVTLAAVLDRIAEVYPGLPLYCMAKAHGFARGPDHKRYLTAAEYRSIGGRQPYLHAMSRDDFPPWYVDIYDDTYAKLYQGGWTDWMIWDTGTIAAAFDIVRDLPEVRAYSEKKYGSAAAWESRFRQRCLKEMSFLAMATPPTMGNTVHAYIKGAVPLGIATRNAEVFRKGLDIVETYMVNNSFPDAMAGDAAFNYAAMTQGYMMGLAWLNRHYGGVDLAERFPLMKELG
ncbi:MAG: hypothetical protein JXR37_11960, partial [Kiritimatiellae bacterium]|nr:hypothetical protein [Kiritimatiellia bacterium]